MEARSDSAGGNQLSEEDLVSSVDSWLQPLPDESARCGPDLEYDNAMLALNQAVAGKPETQFDAGIPPDWPAVRDQASSLLDKTRDLRIAVLWVRASVQVSGFAALPDGLRLLHGLLHAFWPDLHPQLDAEDGGAPYARMNALGPLGDLDGLLGDLRMSVLVRQRGIGELRVRSVEVALGLLQAKVDEPTFTREQVVQMLSTAVQQDAATREWPERALAHLKALEDLLNERASGDAPDLQALRDMVLVVAGVMPAPPGAETGDEAVEGSEASGDGAGAPRLSGAVKNRDDALRAIDMVCEFLERTEPTSPAPLLLRRARRMINRNFLQLMKELAPDSLAEVARVMGVDPESVTIDPLS